MSELLSRRLMQSRFEGPHHEALLALMVAHASLEGMFDDLFDGTGITQSQYNVLRILNGAHPNAYARGDIARRMVRRAPDLTRMLDRLVRMGFVEREKGEKDHRQSLARITAKGRSLVETLHPKVQQVTQMLSQRLTVDDAQVLAGLLEKIYAKD